MGHKDLRLGQIVYMLIFYNISFSWFLPLDGFQFIFLLRDSENDLLGNRTQQAISAIRQGGLRGRNGVRGREGGVPPSPHHATLGTTVCFTCLDDYES